METVNIAYQTPEAERYLSKMPAQRIANMARVCQMLRNNGLEQMMQMQQQGGGSEPQTEQWEDHNAPSNSTFISHNVLVHHHQHHQHHHSSSNYHPHHHMHHQSHFNVNGDYSSYHNVPQMSSYQNHNARIEMLEMQSMQHQQQQQKDNVPMQCSNSTPVKNNNISSSSDSSIESHPYVLHLQQYQQKQQTTSPPPPPPKKQPLDNQTTTSSSSSSSKFNPVSCLRRSWRVGCAGKSSKSKSSAATKESTESKDSIASPEKKSPFSKQNWERATFHGMDRLSGQVDLGNSVASKLDNDKMAVRDKVDMVMGKAILKLSVYVNSGILTVHVDKAKHLQSSLSHVCNSFLKVTLLPDDNSAHCTSRMAPGTNHPAYDERLSFELAKGSGSKRVYISVHHKRTADDVTGEFLGSMSFGVRNIITNNRKVDGWYYLLHEEIGCRKHLQAIMKKTE